MLDRNQAHGYRFITVNNSNTKRRRDMKITVKRVEAVATTCHVDQNC
jgi:hypothetical protein